MNSKEMRDFQKVLDEAKKDIDEILEAHDELYAREKEIKSKIDATS